MFLIYFDYLIIFIQKFPMGKKLKETHINTSRFKIIQIIKRINVFVFF